jgi:hypothetical protein
LALTSPTSGGRSVDDDDDDDDDDNNNNNKVPIYLVAIKLYKYSY